MNKNYLYVLPLALAMVAFSGQSVAQGKDDECKGDPQAPEVNLNLKAAKNKVNPDCVFVHLGSTIVFRLTPKNGLELGTVTIEPEYPLDSWLRGSNNAAKNVILIEVPGEHDTEKPSNERVYTDHNYVIKVNGTVLDPRIQVEH